MSRRHHQVYSEVEHLILHANLCGHDEFQLVPANQFPACSEWHCRASDFALLDASGQVCYVGSPLECEGFF